MNRLVVLGGLGMFGRTAVDELRARGLDPLVASRRAGADIQLDANDPRSVRAGLQASDLVVDAAGPFHGRSTALVEAAIDVGFDVIDISDDYGYAEKLLGLAGRVERAGIRVLNACSSVSAVAACMVALSGCERPVRVSGFIAPATRHTANPASALALVRSVGRPVQVWRGGEPVERQGWSEVRRLALPRRVLSSRLFESADAVHLPRRWPTLRDVATYVDTNTPGLNTLLRVAARVPALRRLIERRIGFATRLSRLVSSRFGALAYEIEADSGATARMAATSGETGYVIPIAPAVLAAASIAAGRFAGRGLVPPDRQVDPAELRTYLASHGIEIHAV